MLIDNFVEAIKPHMDFDSVKVILDVGTRDLEQSEELHTVFPQAHIYAFEPNPESFKKLKSNGYITVYPFAVMDYDGEIPFYSVAQRDNYGASSVFEPTDAVVGVDLVEGLNRIVVPCKRIDTWANEENVPKIDIVWQDVQGTELQVLQSFGTLLNDVQAIATEVETGALYYPNRKYQPTQYFQLKDYMEEHSFLEVGYVQAWPLEADTYWVKVK